MLTNAELRQANAYAGRILLNASCVKVQAPLPMGVRPIRAVHEPPQVEYVLWVDVYEVSCNALLSNELQVEVSFGPHVLKSPPVMIEEAGSYTLEAEQGRMEELKVYLPGAVKIAVQVTTSEGTLMPCSFLGSHARASVHSGQRFMRAYIFCICMCIHIVCS